MCACSFLWVLIFIFEDRNEFMVKTSGLEGNIVGILNERESGGHE